MTGKIGAILGAAVLAGASASAQTAPLSAIEWLGQNAPALHGGPTLLEPPVTDQALRPEIDVQPLDQSAVPLGLVPANVTGLPIDLWRGSDAAELTRLIAEAPVANSPAMQTLLFTLLLSETRPPDGADAAERMLLARIDRLMDLGAVDPAKSLAEVAGPGSSPALFRRWFDAALLSGEEEAGCLALAKAPYLLPDYDVRIFCGLRSGDWQTAALLLETAHALDVLPAPRLALLDRFLSPEIFEGAPALAIPDDPDPLTFRLFESIGEPLPSAPLPRAFANADLRDLAGWKAQVEAAERLTRIGALAPNRLLGLYTDRKPAASGGVWDRVRAVQRFETALDSGSTEAVTKTLPTVWAAMQQAGLEVGFATLFADRLAALTLADDAAQELLWTIRMLSPDYETAALAAPRPGKESAAFLTVLAQGTPGAVPAHDKQTHAIALGFDPTTQPPQRIRNALGAGSLGEAILLAIALFEQGASGNPADLSGALATFRALGLEDVARRAALQLILLERRG